MADYTKPKDMIDDQLIDRYEQIWHKAVGNFRTEAKASLLVNELNRRQVEKAGKLSMKISILSLALSVFAILFAGLSVTFSYLDWKGDITWQNQQIEVLHQISNSVQK